MLKVNSIFPISVNVSALCRSLNPECYGITERAKLLCKSGETPDIKKKPLICGIGIMNPFIWFCTRSKALAVYNSSKIASYTFSSVPQFFDVNNVKPVE